MANWRAAVIAGILAGLALTAIPARAGELQAFGSERALADFLKLRAPRKRYPAAPPPPVVMAAPPPPSATTPVPSLNAADVVVTGAKASTPSITNTQEADVDEGGIVKFHGRHLVVLRRGRLFTVEVGDRRLRAVDRIDAFPPGAKGDAWYDEMLVAGDSVVVIGYSYARDGTEISRFAIDDDGRLRYRDTYQLRSNDYYSSSNYASRLIGDRLIFYTPLEIDPERPIAPQLPALRRWTGDENGAFRRIAPATRIYLPRPVRRDPDAEIDTLHTVTTCDLAAPVLARRATAVLGSESENFYVSGQAVYIWIADALRR